MAYRRLLLARSPLPLWRLKAVALPFPLALGVGQGNKGAKRWHIQPMKLKILL